jgi:hypothetical protein
VVFNQQTAYFLLNFFWAVGLSNKNPILDSGPIQEYSQGKIENFASTGGWSLAKNRWLKFFEADDDHFDGRTARIWKKQPKRSPSLLR